MTVQESMPVYVQEHNGICEQGWAGHLPVDGALWKRGRNMQHCHTVCMVLYGNVLERETVHVSGSLFR